MNSTNLNIYKKLGKKIYTLYYKLGKKILLI